jgi:hypothetical protein
MLRLIGIPGLGFVLRPVVLALAGAAFLAGMHAERTTAERRCVAAGGVWTPPGVCVVTAE